MVEYKVIFKTKVRAGSGRFNVAVRLDGTSASTGWVPLNVPEGATQAFQQNREDVFAVKSKRSLGIIKALKITRANIDAESSEWLLSDVRVFDENGCSWIFPYNGWVSNETITLSSKTSSKEDAGLPIVITDDSSPVQTPIAPQPAARLSPTPVPPKKQLQAAQLRSETPVRTQRPVDPRPESPPIGLHYQESPPQTVSPARRDYAYTPSSRFIPPPAAQTKEEDDFAYFRAVTQQRNANTVTSPRGGVLYNGVVETPPVEDSRVPGASQQLYRPPLPQEYHDPMFETNGIFTDQRQQTPAHYARPYEDQWSQPALPEYSRGSDYVYRPGKPYKPKVTKNSRADELGISDDGVYRDDNVDSFAPLPFQGLQDEPSEGGFFTMLKRMFRSDSPGPVPPQSTWTSGPAEMQFTLPPSRTPEPQPDYYPAVEETYTSRLPPQPAILPSPSSSGPPEMFQTVTKRGSRGSYGLVAGPILGFRGQIGANWRVSVLVVTIDKNPRVAALPSLDYAAAPHPNRHIKVRPQCVATYTGGALLEGFDAWQQESSASLRPFFRIWRFDWQVEQSFTEERGCVYQIDGDDRFGFVVPAANASPRIAFCTGNSSPLAKQGPDADFNYLWTRMQEQASLSPIHLLIMGGAQVCGDSVWHTVEGLRRLMAMNDRDALLRPPDQYLKDDITGFYVRSYLREFTFPSRAWVLARVPSIMIWDDHDIYEGAGMTALASKPDVPLVKGVFSVARDYFWVFQRQGDASTLLSHNPTGDINGPFTSFYAAGCVGILSLDLRTERTRDQAMSDHSLDVISGLLQRLPTPPLQHLFVVSPVPVGFVDCSAVEKTTAAVLGAESVLEDMLDHWSAPMLQAQKQRLLTMLFDFSAKRQVQVTILSGDIKVGALLKIESKTHGVSIFQPISSAMVVPPPGLRVTSALQAAAGIKAVKSALRRPKGPQFDESLLPLDYQGSHKLARAENFLLLQPRGVGSGYDAIWLMNNSADFSVHRLAVSLITGAPIQS